MGRPEPVVWATPAQLPHLGLGPSLLPSPFQSLSEVLGVVGGPGHPVSVPPAGTLSGGQGRGQLAGPEARGPGGPGGSHQGALGRGTSPAPQPRCPLYLALCALWRELGPGGEMSLQGNYRRPSPITHSSLISSALEVFLPTGSFPTPNVINALRLLQVCPA